MYARTSKSGMSDYSPSHKLMQCYDVANVLFNYEILQFGFAKKYYDSEVLA